MMRSTQPTLFLVWQFDTENRTQTAILRAVDTTIETAQAHKQHLERFIPFPENAKDGDRHFSEAKVWQYNAYQETWNRVEFPLGGERFYCIESLSANHLFGAKGGLGTLGRINGRKPL